MCGIAGFAGGFERGLAQRMATMQAHRGPDGNGVFEDSSAEIALSHVRLAILDLSDAASQPMFSDNRRFVLVFNGEIYNFAALRAEVAAKDRRPFRSTSDTEVLLRGLELQGSDFVSRLNGIFAFALWDQHTRELMLVRDPLGVKPLYYAHPTPGTLLFASEIKALCAHSPLCRDVDFIALRQHLAYGHAAADRTALAAVRRLPPGHLLRWRASTRTWRTARYWQPRFSDGAPAGHATAHDLRDHLRSAVKRQLVSDVPVGALLSGGLDSSLVTTLAIAESTAPLDAYTTTYRRGDNVIDRVDNDLPHAKALASRLRIRLHELELRPQLASLLPRLIAHLDEPLADPAAIACHLISTAARDRGTRVLLSGQGADELFGGYPRYAVMSATEWTRHMPPGVLHMASALAGYLPGGGGGAAGAALRRIRRAAAPLALSFDQRFLSYCAATPVNEVDAVLGPAFRDQLSGDDGYSDCRRHMDTEGVSGLNRGLERDLSVYLPNHNLMYTDKMGMAAGVEIRVPLLDLELVEFATRLPLQSKTHRGRTKVILRAAARGVVPDSIIDRPKTGFAAPYRKWLRDDLHEMWSDLASAATLGRRGWFNHRALHDARERSVSGRTDLYMLQWAVLTIELWAQQFIDDTSAVKALPQTA